MVRLTNEQGQVVSNTIKVTTGGNIVVDNTRPTCTITADTTDITNVDSIKYTIEFSEAVIGFTIEDITVNNGTKGEFTKVNETTYTIVVTNNTDCIQTVIVAEGVCTDIANNQNIQGSKEININRTVPTIVISPNGSSATKETNVIITASGVNELSGKNEYKYCLTQNQDLQGNETWQDYISGEPITIGTGLNGTYYIHTKQIYDVAGNYSEAVTSNPFIFDNTAPTCNITAYVSGANVINTITFSEEVTDFKVENITVSNGTKGSFSGSGTTYSLTVTGGSEGTQTVSVPANVCTDSAGNGNTASNTKSITISTKYHGYGTCGHIGECDSGTTYTCPYCAVVVSSSYYTGTGYHCPNCSYKTNAYYIGHGCYYTVKTVN